MAWQTTPPSRELTDAEEVHEFSYPFIRGEYTFVEPEGFATAIGWRPGVRFEQTRDGDTDTVADGIGRQIVTVVGRFKPGKFHERVFFTRQWRDPSGHVFGKGTLHIKAAGAFRSLIGGYRHPFGLSAGTVEIKPEPKRPQRGGR